jgi:hypothetical protein
MKVTSSSLIHRHKEFPTKLPKGENARVDVDSDAELFVKPEFKVPWENPELVSKQNQRYDA